MANPDPDKPAPVLTDFAEVLGFELRPYQREFLDALQRADRDITRTFRFPTNMDLRRVAWFGTAMNMERVIEAERIRLEKLVAHVAIPPEDLDPGVLKIFGLALANGKWRRIRKARGWRRHVRRAKALARR